MNAETDRRRLRRPLSLEELERLLAAAHTAPPIQGVAGADRVILYIIACYTGFRRNEISSVTCRSLDLASVPPMLTVPAAYSKRRRVDIIPLRKDLAELLRVWMAGKGELRPDEPLLNIRWKRTAEMLRKDLERARAAWIDESPTAAERSARERSSFLTYQDDAGRVADFHALRKTFVTNLCLAGVSPKATQTLARHSDINLTMNTYTMLGVGDQVFIERGAGPKTQPAAKPAAAPGQFYSLDKDLAETNDLAREHAEQVKQMEQTLQQIRQSGRSRP